MPARQLSRIAYVVGLESLMEEVKMRWRGKDWNVKTPSSVTR
jgi:hypothetical protein